MEDNQKERSLYVGEFDIFSKSDIEKIQGKNLYSPEKVMKDLKNAVKHYRDMKEVEPTYKKELYKYGKLFDIHFDEFDRLEWDMIERPNFEF